MPMLAMEEMELRGESVLRVLGEMTTRWKMACRQEGRRPALIGVPPVAQR